jgi:acetyltransferase
MRRHAAPQGAEVVATLEYPDDTGFGVARYAINPDGESCEFALVVNDQWQKQGIGHKLMDVLMDVARGKGMKVMEGEVLKTNRPMLKLVEALGFRIEPLPEDDTVRRISREL